LGSYTALLLLLFITLSGCGNSTDVAQMRHSAGSRSWWVPTGTVGQ